MTAGAALKDLARTIAQYAVRRASAARATKPFRPACRFERLLALHLGAVIFDKLWHRQPRLKLDSIHRHDGHLSLSGNHHSTDTLSQRMRLADEIGRAHV